MIAICGWCQVREQTLTILDGTPVDRAVLAIEMSDTISEDDAFRISHSICPRHNEAARAEIEAMRAKTKGGERNEATGNKEATREAQAA